MSNQNLAAACIEALGRVIYGKEAQIREILLALLAGGHVLLEDIPGVGKTRLARAFARVLGLEFRRVQFTPDLMPSDLTGFSVWRRDREQFVYQPGSLFCNLLLADELNRTSPKTQSALLEAMEERQVSVEGVTRALPRPFFVLATQNPLGSAGTQPLPPAQLDRFLVSLSLGYPDRDSELALVNAPADEARLAELPVLLNPRTLQAWQQEIAELYISDQVGAYLVDLVRATRQNPALRQGASPRATLALARLARASAWLDGRDFAIPRDVAGQYTYALAHRLQRTDAARLAGTTAGDILQEILAAAPAPTLGARR